MLYVGVPLPRPLIFLLTNPPCKMLLKMTIIKQFLVLDTFTYRLTGYFSFQRFYSPPFLKNSTREKSLNITDSALNQLKVLKQKFPEKSLRVAVEAGGCHGFQCKFSLDPETEFNLANT